MVHIKCREFQPSATLAVVLEYHLGSLWLTLLGSIQAFWCIQLTWPNFQLHRGEWVEHTSPLLNRMIWHSTCLERRKHCRNERRPPGSLDTILYRRWGGQVLPPPIPKARCFTAHRETISTYFKVFSISFGKWFLEDYDFTLRGIQPQEVFICKVFDCRDLCF